MVMGVNKDEDLLEDLTIIVRGKLARAATSSSLDAQTFCQVFVERLVASTVLAMDLNLKSVHAGIDAEHNRLRGEDSDA
jgi:hypothetical protein